MRKYLTFLPAIFLISCGIPEKEIMKKAPNLKKPFEVEGIKPKIPKNPIPLYPLTVKVRNTPLSVVLKGVCKAENLNCDYNNFDKLNFKVSINYKGNLRDFLSYLKDRFGIDYKYDRGVLVFIPTLKTDLIAEEKKKKEILETKKITLNAEDLPLKDLLNILNLQTGYIFTADKGVDLSQKITIEVKNVSLDRFLDSVLTPLGYSYEIDPEKGIIKIVSYRKLIFEIPFLNKQVNYSFNLSGDEGNTQISIRSNFWQDVENTLKGLLSSSGKYTIDKRQGIIVVWDRPDRLRLIKEYLEKVKKKAENVCRFRLGIFEINYSRNISTGIDWRRVFYNKDGKTGEFHFTANTGDVYSFQLNLAKQGTLSFNFAIQIFSEYGKVKTLYDQYIETVCGDTVSILAGEVFNYLEKVEVQTGYQTGLVSRIPVFNQLHLGPEIFITMEKVNDKTYQAVINITDKYIKSFRTYNFDQNTYNIPERIGQNQIALTTYLRKGELEIIAGFKHFKYNSDKQGLPFLEDMPVISGQKYNFNLSEYVVLIQPY